MATIIIYLSDITYINRTIDEIIDKTPASLIDEIIVCDDNDQDYTHKRAKVLKTNDLGKAACWNRAVRQTASDRLVFLRDTTKLSEEWLQPLLIILDRDQNALVGPRIHSLDTALWATENDCWSRIGWRWDMKLYGRQHVGRPESPAISNYCFATSKQWFEKIGGFDEGLRNAEDIEISLRTWLFGGTVFMTDDSFVAVRHQADVGRRLLDDSARIVEAWLPSYLGRFLAVNKASSNDLRTGRLNELLKLRDNQTKSDNWFIETIQPELGKIYELYGSAPGKSVGVIGYGHSVDFIDSAIINRCDVLVGVDYMGLAYDCNYIVTDSTNVVVESRRAYQGSSFVVPFFLFDRASASYISTNDIINNSIQFEFANEIGKVGDVFPPFCNFEQSLHAAIQFALFLKPKQVLLFGCDNKLVFGKSHSAKIGYYSDGEIWLDSEITRKRYAFFEYGLNGLGNLASSLGIPLIRINHV